MYSLYTFASYSIEKENESLHVQPTHGFRSFSLWSILIVELQKEEKKKKESKTSTTIAYNFII